MVIRYRILMYSCLHYRAHGIKFVSTIWGGYILDEYLLNFYFKFEISIIQVADIETVNRKQLSTVIIILPIKNNKHVSYYY